MIYVIIAIIQAIIFGFATRIVIINKGYDDNWFWWGFFFGLVALIVACAKPRNIKYSTFTYPTYDGSSVSYSGNETNATSQAYNEKVLASGGWKCTCGRTLEAYVFSCACGKNKYDVLKNQHKQEQEEGKKEECIEETNTAIVIKKYKELLDMGAITQE